MKSYLITLLTLSLGVSALALEPPKTEPAALPDVAWQSDPLAQFVFFAVLEGCYRDGIQNEVVDLIINPKKGPDNKVKHCFVLRCELCHAVFEAFKVYAERPAFAQSSGRNTFGKGVDKDFISQLKSKEPRTRVYAMGDLVRPWIQQRVAQHRMTAEEQAAMKKRFEAYIEDGKKLLGKYRKLDPAYVDWMFYGSCQACEAAKDFGKNEGYDR